MRSQSHTLAPQPNWWLSEPHHFTYAVSATVT